MADAATINLGTFQPKASPIRQRAYEILDTLPDDDIQKVLDYLLELSEENDCPFEPLTKEQIYTRLESSRQQSKDGNVKSADMVIEHFKAKYGL